MPNKEPTEEDLGTLPTTGLKVTFVGQESGKEYELEDGKLVPVAANDKEPTKEWKVLVRDWWYKYQDAGYELPETGRVELEDIFKQALSAREEALVEKVSGIDNYPESIFGKPWDGWEKDIDELAKSKGYSIQHIAAHYAHWQEGIVKGEVIALIKG